MNVDLAITLYLRKNKNKENGKMITQCFYLILDSCSTHFVKQKIPTFVGILFIYKLKIFLLCYVSKSKKFFREIPTRLEILLKYKSLILFYYFHSLTHESVLVAILKPMIFVICFIYNL